MKKLERLNPFGRFCCTIGNLPASYMESLTYEEQLLWFCDFLENKVIPAINDEEVAIEELQALFVELKDYVEHYLDNLDIQTDINNKLDEMATDGTLARIINQEIFDELNQKTKTMGVYAPSLLNSAGSEMCTLVMTDTKAVLFDLGRNTSISYNLNYFQSKLGDRKVDAVVISHYHADHMGGIEGLADLYSDDVVFYLPMNFIGYFNGTEDSAPTIAQRNQVLTFLSNNNITYYEIDEDTTIDLDDFTISLTGSTDSAYSYYNSVSAPTLNTYSMNALVKFGESKVLFPGDSKIETQDYLVSHNQVEKVNLYCSPHHGYEREINTKYQKIINPDYEWFSLSPLSWNAIDLLDYDYGYRDKPKYNTQAESDVEYVLTHSSMECTKGNFVNDFPFVNKVYTVYVDSNYSGIPLGTEEAPYKSIAQVLANYPQTGCDLTIYLADGTYSPIRLKNLNNRIQIIANNSGEVTFNNCQIQDCYDLILYGITFESLDTDHLTSVNGGNIYFNSCSFKCSATTSGNNAISLQRCQAHFNSCTFSNCYTALYANRCCLIDMASCTYNASNNALQGYGSYISTTGYTITSGQFRAEQGCLIQTINKGPSSNRPSFNNSNYMRGYQYFDTTIGKPVFYLNSGGNDGWILADGTSA